MNEENLIEKISQIGLLLSVLAIGMILGLKMFARGEAQRLQTENFLGFCRGWQAGRKASQPPAAPAKPASDTPVAAPVEVPAVAPATA